LPVWLADELGLDVREWGLEDQGGDYLHPKIPRQFRVHPRWTEDHFDVVEFAVPNDRLGEPRLKGRRQDGLRGDCRGAGVWRLRAPAAYSAKIALP
jgi:hypothetical protein